MDILYLLIPLSSVLVLAILGVFAWALYGGQFDDIEQHGAQILESDRASFDPHQGSRGLRVQESASSTLSCEQPGVIDG